MFRKAYLSVAVLAIAVLAQMPSTQNSIAVISTSQKTLFPDEVVFFLEAQSSRDIEEITLVYRVEGARVSTYGYADFESGTHVRARTTVETSGGSYLPPGVDLRYHYVIRDSSGSEFETEPQVYKYRDPRFHWREMTSGPLTVLWYDYREESVRQTMSEVGERLERVRRIFDLEEEEAPIKAVLYRSGQSASQAFPMVSETSRELGLFGGFAFSDYSMFLLTGLDADGMVHESSHVMLDAAIGSPLARVPAWLNEGLATYFQGPSGQFDSIVNSAAARGDLVPIRHMNSVPGRPRDVDLFYPQAQSFVTFLIEQYGEEKMTRLIKTLDGGRGVDQALQSAYGLTLNELDANWQAHLSGQESPFEPGTFSYLPVLGASGIFALLAAITFAYRFIKSLRRSDSPGDLLE